MCHEIFLQNGGKFLKNINGELTRKKKRPTIIWGNVKPDPKVIGRVIRKFGKQYNLKISQLEIALEQANRNQPDGWEKRDSEKDAEGKTLLAHNYIYRSWPNISMTATLNIVCKAFEAQLSKTKRYTPDEIKGICKNLKEKIRAEYTIKASRDSAKIASNTISEFIFTRSCSEYAFFVGKNLAAFSSLTNWDILFWDSLTTLSEEERKKTYDKFRKYKVNYQTVISPAFQQWITLRSKNYSDSIRKPKKAKRELSKKFLTQLQKLSFDESNSVNHVLDRLIARSDSEEGKKYPLAPPLELDLLILFKYCLSEKMQMQYIEQKKLQKSGG